MPFATCNDENAVYSASLAAARAVLMTIRDIGLQYYDRPGGKNITAELEAKALRGEKTLRALMDTQQPRRRFRFFSQPS